MATDQGTADGNTGSEDLEFFDTTGAGSVAEALENLETGAILFAGGTGTESDPFLIQDYNSMSNISELCVWNDQTSRYDSYNYFKVKDNVTEINCFGSTLSVNLCGSFDGNGVTFNNVNSSIFERVVGETGVLAEGSAYIKNFTVNFGNMNNGGVLDWNTLLNLVMENITVHGYIENSYNIASLIDYGGRNNQSETHVTIRNCTSDATIVYTQGNACGLIGHPYSNSSSTFTIINSEFTGKMYSSSGKGCEITSFGVAGTVTRDGATITPNQTQYSSDKLFKITTENGVNPDKYSVFTTTAANGFDHAKAILTIGPNGNGTTVIGGYYCSDYIVETDLENNNGTISTKTIKYFDITSNGNATSETGISADGKTFNIVNPNYNNVIGGASVRLIQYDALGNILKITTWNVTPN